MQVMAGPFFEFKAPVGVKLWDLGKEKNWGALEASLEVLTAQDAVIRSPVDDDKLAEIRRDFDGSKGPTAYGILHQLSHWGDNADLLKKILSIGVNPDLEGEDLWRPSHLCGAYGRVELMKVLLLCRPDMAAKNGNGQTPLQAAAVVQVSL
jgi:ankyrin repeat protein